MISAYDICGQVLYEGKRTAIEYIDVEDAVIVNPFWDWDEEALCEKMGENYDMPYWIRVKLSELLPIKEKT